jgi:MarR family transcriptional regulator, 2-MHQ and catechol-resistance regulon repressor
MQISALTSIKPQVADQARRLHRAVTELMRRYQFRDRNEICCFGVSVSQCHALEALGQAGELTMGELASQMHLSVSTVTRVVDQLVARGLAQRGEDAKDRRVCCVEPTPKGRELLGRISAELLEGETAILTKVPAEHRESVIHALEELSRAVDEWRGVERRQEGGCCVETTDG